MIPATREDQKREAFRLFEDGRYTESLRLCQVFSGTGRDPAIEVLAATNLFFTGKLEDAEAAFLDLARTMPDSSYVHSYLAKVLEARGDERAIAEYAAAVHLDPTNQDALRSYAGYLLGRKDYRGALRVLRRLVHLGKKPADVRNLMRALIEVGEPAEALAAHADMADGGEKSHEYIDALHKTGNFPAAAEAACALYRTTQDKKVLRKYLEALSRYDHATALDTYASHTVDEPDPEILFDYVLLLRSAGSLKAAGEATRTLLAIAPDPVYRLFACDLLAETGRDAEALATYEALIRDELASKNNLEQLGQIIGHYREFLKKHPDPGVARKRFLDLVSKDVNVASLTETARFFLDRGEAAEARSWYYRAYRTDFLVGGPEYARFLISQGEDRECEKVMLYVLANVKKGATLTRVAATILDEKAGMSRLKRLMDQLIRRLEEQRPSLDSEGLDLLAMAYFITATNALEEMDYATCKYLCLAGMDILPTHPQALHLEDFLRLIRASKARAVADRPIMHARPAQGKTEKAPTAETLADQLGLTGPEIKIAEFLRSHRKATEMDLRTVLGTRRVVGMVNILIQKAAAKGIPLIEKKGIGEEGEIYEYTGT